MAEKFQAPLMCKECTKDHDMLLHRDDDCLSQQKPEENSKGETHVAVLCVNKQVLLMTCKMKVTTTDGTNTIARALIDPGSSASFIHERLAQHLRQLVVRKMQEWKELLEPVHLHTRFHMGPGV